MRSWKEELGRGFGEECCFGERMRSTSEPYNDLKVRFDGEIR